jgi:cell division protein FtsB
MANKKSIIPVEAIERRILLIRGQKVMLDSDLAQLYGVSTKRLNEQVKRNRKRFPVGFMFQLSEQEKSEVVANCDHLKNLRFSPVLPHAFTEHGAIMLASVLNSGRAIEVSIYVVKAFVNLRETLAKHRTLTQKLSKLERKFEKHDEEIQSLFHAIRQLMTPPDPKRHKIGFILRERAAKYGRSRVNSAE